MWLINVRAVALGPYSGQLLCTVWMYRVEQGPCSTFSNAMQDRVPAFPDSRARAIFEAQLGAPPEQLFATFNELPLAAASLGQVWMVTDSLALSARHITKRITPEMLSGRSSIAGLDLRHAEA